MKRLMAIGMVLAASAVLQACGGDGEAATPADSAAASAAAGVTLGERDVAVATSSSLREGVAVSGSLEPKVSNVVGAPIAEQITEMLVEEGSPVRQGQVVARFRDDVLRAEAASARAEVTRARLAVRLALTDSSRSETLFREGAIARRDYDNALATLEGARSQLALAEARASQADDRLETATLKAPVSGVVSERHAQAGDRVDFGKPVLTIVDTRVLQLAASVPAQDIAAMRIGREVSLSATTGEQITGRISRINPTADAATRQVRFYVDVPNGAGRLVGGIYVSGRAIIREVSNAVSVPVRAIRREGTAGEVLVYAVREGVIRKITVTPGVEDGDQGLVQILSGLAAGDTVVVGPVDNLSDGTRVAVAAAAAVR